MRGRRTTGRGPAYRKRRVSRAHRRTPRFNLALTAIQPHRGGPPVHAHEAEDDAFYIFEDELTFVLDSEIVAGPGTFVLVPPDIEHTFENRGNTLVRLLNVHAPAGFDRRLEED